MRRRTRADQRGRVHATIVLFKRNTYKVRADDFGKKDERRRYKKKKNNKGDGEDTVVHPIQSIAMPMGVIRACLRAVCIQRIHCAAVGWDWRINRESSEHIVRLYPGALPLAPTRPD